MISIGPRRERGEDYRMMLARQLMGGDGMRGGGAVGAAAGAGSQIIGALLAKRAQDDQRQQMAADQAQNRAYLSAALRQMSGTPSGTTTLAGGDQIEWEAQAPDMMAAGRTLAQNPDTAGMGTEVLFQALARKQGLADRDEERAYADRVRAEERAARAAEMDQQRAFQRELVGMRGQSNQFNDMLTAAGIQPGTPEARAFIDANFGKGSVETKPTAVAQIGSGFAGGTPTDVLYDPNNMIDRQQARIDAQEAAKAQAQARAAAGQASGDLAQAAQMQAANEIAYTGPLATVNQWGNQFLGMVGNEAARQRASAFETLEAGGADMARAERTPGEGAVSDFDAKQFLKIVPGPGRTEEFNTRALQAREAAFRATQDKVQFLDEFRRRNGNLTGAEDAWLRYSQANPILNPELDLNRPETLLNPNRQDWRTFFGLTPAQPAPAPAPGAGPQSGGMVTVTNGTETLMIPAEDVPAAQRDGYRVLGGGQ